MKKSISKYILIFSSFIFVIVVGYFYALHENTTLFVQKISKECQLHNKKETQSCFSGKILSHIKDDPSSAREVFDVIWKLLENSGISEDARIFSPIIHDVGMLLIEKKIPLTQAISYCSFTFRGGCLHGVVMEHIDGMGSDVDVRTLVKKCDSLIAFQDKNNDDIFSNCTHALGHEFAAKTKGSLNNILLLCDTVPVYVRDSCLYGVFMEYSKGGSGEGFHSEKPVGRKELPCRDLDKSFKRVCYASSGFYRQYEIDTEPFEATYRFCMKDVPDEYRRDCFDGVRSALLFSQANVVKRADAVCRTLSKDVEKYCLDSVGTSD